VSTTSTLFPRSNFLHGTAVRQLAWFAIGAVVAFLIPFLFSSVLDLNHDAYYAVYFLATGAFLAAYAKTTQLNTAALFTRNWRWSVGLGIVAAAFLVFRILSAEGATPNPDGLYFAFEIGWRGAIYGAVDALLLTAFPLAVVYVIFGGRLDTLARRTGYAALTLALVWVITATYHLGYEQFRDDGVTGPEAGNTIISIPAIATANPIGAVVAHVAMHLTAVTHAYETDLYLPPQTFSDGE
jgi:hypothetical protein